MMSVRKWVLSALLLAPASGCSSLSDFHYEQTQQARARAAWRAHGSAPNCYAKDYEAGWKDGFYDIATGGKGCPPLVAPCKYWAPEQILEDRDRARNAYYSGYQDGVACSLRYPQTHYLKLWTSCECPGPECKEGCPTGACVPCQSLPSFEGGSGLAVPGEYYTDEMVPMPVDGPIDAGLSTSVERIPTTEIDSANDPGKLKSNQVTEKAAVVTETEAVPLPPADQPVAESTAGAPEAAPVQEAVKPSLSETVSPSSDVAEPAAPAAPPEPSSSTPAEQPAADGGVQLAPPIDFNVSGLKPAADQPTGSGMPKRKSQTKHESLGMIDDYDGIGLFEPAANEN